MTLCPSMLQNRRTHPLHKVQNLLIHDPWSSLLRPTRSPIRFDECLISKTKYCLALLPSMCWLKKDWTLTFYKGWQWFWNALYLHLHRALSGLRGETFGFNRLWSEVVGEMYKPLNLASFASQSSCAILFPCLFLQCHFEVKIPRRNTTKCNIPEYNSTPHNVILLKCKKKINL